MGQSRSPTMTVAGRARERAGRRPRRRGGASFRVPWAVLAAWAAVVAALLLIMSPLAGPEDPLAGEAVPALAPGSAQGLPASDDESANRGLPAWPPVAQILKGALRSAIPGMAAVEAPQSPPAPGGVGLENLVRRFFEGAGGVMFGNPWTLLAAELPALRVVEIPEPGTPLVVASSSLLPEYRPADLVGTGDGNGAGSPGGIPDDAAPTWEAPEGDPLVLIYHSHGSEAFLGAIPAGSGINPNVAGFTADANRNIIRVGLDLRRHLEEQFGIGVVHVTDLFDWQEDRVTRIGAYYRSLQMLENFGGTGRRVTEVHPSLRVILDVHRDAVPRHQSLARIEGRDLARVLFIVGTRPQNHPRWRENLCFATVLHNLAEELYPGLSRGIQRRSGERFNQHVLSGAVLLEIGSVENDLVEALATAEMVARVVNEAFRRGLVPEPGQAYACPVAVD